MDDRRQTQHIHEVTTMTDTTDNHLTWGPKRWPVKFETWLILTFCRIFFGLKMYGLEKAPRTGRLLVVSNHESLIDPGVVGAAIPREIFYAAKSQLFKGLLGKWVRYHRAIPIRRTGSDKEAMRLLTEQLKNDEAVLIFPQGTRRTDPNDRSIKPGVGMLAMWGGADLLPMRVANTRYSEFGWKGLWSMITRKNPVRVYFGDPIRLADLLKDNPPRKEAYYRIAEEVMNTVWSLGEDDPKASPPLGKPSQG